MPASMLDVDLGGRVLEARPAVERGVEGDQQARAQLGGQPGRPLLRLEQVLRQRRRARGGRPRPPGCPRARRRPGPGPCCRGPACSRRGRRAPRSSHGGGVEEDAGLRVADLLHVGVDGEGEIRVDRVGEAERADQVDRGDGVRHVGDAAADREALADAHRQVRAEEQALGPVVVEREARLVGLERAGPQDVLVGQEQAAGQGDVQLADPPRRRQRRPRCRASCRPRGRGR